MIQNVKRNLIRASLGLLLLFFAVSSARSQDVRVNCSQNATCTLTPTGGIVWSNGNLIWVFKPLNPRVSIYIFIRNYNTTNAHTSQTVQVFQTPFSQDSAPNLSLTASRWTQDVVTQNSSAGASCNNVNAANDLVPGASGLGTCYVTTMFAAQVAIKITGAAAQAGSPDNFDLAIVQETGVPGGQNPGSNAATSVQPVSAPLSTSPGGALPSGMSSAPSAGGQAQAIALARPGFRHVVHCISFSAAATTAPVATALSVTLQDSVSSTVVFNHTVVITASTGQLIPPVSICGLDIAGSVNSAWTLQFSNSLANLFESTAMSWFDVPQ